jgi:hypothetical protein
MSRDLSPVGVLSLLHLEAMSSELNVRLDRFGEGSLVMPASWRPISEVAPYCRLLWNTPGICSAEDSRLPQVLRF